MHSIIIFLFASLASFIGSLQLGPVNLFVINTTLNSNKSSAYGVAFGGIVPEFIYCALAVYSGSYFTDNATIFIGFKILLIAVLIIAGTVYLFKKQRVLQIESLQNHQETSKLKFFIKGFTLAGLNPQLLIYWIFILVYFKGIKFLNVQSVADKIAYILGAGFGAFILLIAIILTITKFKSKILAYLNNKYYYKALGLLLIVISIQQLITLL